MSQTSMDAFREQVHRGGPAAQVRSQGDNLQSAAGGLAPLTSPLKGKPMKIKKFVGGSMSECLLKVKKELGEDAVILDSRKIPRGGPFSFLLTDLIEVVASTDADPVAAGFSRPFGGAGFGGAGRNLSPTAPPSQYALDAVPLIKRQRKGPAVEGSLKGDTIRPWPDGVSAAEFALMSDELHGLKETLGQITDHLKFRQLPSLPQELEILHRGLLENGVEDGVAAALTQEMALRLSGGEFEDRALLRRALHEGIGRLVKVVPLVPPKREGRSTRADRPRVIALVGATGVGKTTTLAKMATHAALLGRLRVGLVSADTYRMAAVEQLKTFAAIAKLGMEAVYRPSDMGRAIQAMAGCEVVLVDTAGRSPNDGAQLQELSAFLEYAGADEVHLVLSMGTRLEDQLAIIRKFSLVKPSRLIFTKLDETTSWGSVLNVCAGLAKAQTGSSQHQGGTLPISLLTWGQDVPDDIISPTQGQLTRLVSERGYYQELKGLGAKG